MRLSRKLRVTTVSSAAKECGIEEDQLIALATMFNYHTFNDGEHDYVALYMMENISGELFDAVRRLEAGPADSSSCMKL